MQDQKIEKIATVAVNITKVLVIIYLGFVEVFKIGKLLREKLDIELDSSRKWATQNYSILKKRLKEQKLVVEMESPFSKEWDKKIIVRMPYIRSNLLRKYNAY